MGALGAGIIGPKSGAYAYLGSSSWVSVAADAPLLDPQMRSMTFNHVIPGRYVPTATMQAGGASLEWVVDTLVPDHDQPERFGTLLGAAAEVEASADGLYFLPHLLGERSPYWNPAARAVFAGLARHHGPAHLTRAVLEGVAFNLFTGLRAIDRERHRHRGCRRDRRGRQLGVVAAGARRRLGCSGDPTRPGRRGDGRRCGRRRRRRRGLVRRLRRRPTLLDRAGPPSCPTRDRHAGYGSAYATVHGRLPAPGAMVRSEPLTPPGSEKASRGWEGHLLPQRIISCTFCPANDRLTPGEVLLTTYAKGRTL